MKQYANQYTANQFTKQNENDNVQDGLKGKLSKNRFNIFNDDHKSDSNANDIITRKVPPPDYYLGESLGTQIWGRLRLAGLETERIFDLDNKNVIIKVKCPEDRLMDVAEVLELELKTRSGEFLFALKAI